jgi:hypothetical protein
LRLFVLTAFGKVRRAYYDAIRGPVLQAPIPRGKKRAERPSRITNCLIDLIRFLCVGDACVPSTEL